VVDVYEVHGFWLFFFSALHRNLFRYPWQRVVDVYEAYGFWLFFFSCAASQSFQIPLTACG
jgi:hypothetical protein